MIFLPLWGAERASSGVGRWSPAPGRRLLLATSRCGHPPLHDCSASCHVRWPAPVPAPPRWCHKMRFIREIFILKLHCLTLCFSCFFRKTIIVLPSTFVNVGNCSTPVCWHIILIQKSKSSLFCSTSALQSLINSRHLGCMVQPFWSYTRIAAPFLKIVHAFMNTIICEKRFSISLLKSVWSMKDSKADPIAQQAETVFATCKSSHTRT